VGLHITKVVFTTLEELFELKVIFFGLIKSPVMFKIIMNEISQNLVNIGKVRSFINNVIVGMEKKER